MNNSNECPQWIASITNETEVESKSEFFLSKIKSYAYTDNHKLEFSHLLSKIDALCGGSEIPSKAKELLMFVDRQWANSEQIKRAIKRLLNPSGMIEEIQEENQEQGKEKASLHELIPKERLAHNLLSGVFGTSILDERGNFIWMDDTSKKHFEVPKTHKGTINLFDLMIPASLNDIKEKLEGSHLFGRDAVAGDSKCLDYVVFSEHQRQIFEKKLKSNKVLTPEKKIEIIEKKDDASIYFHYLSSLTSKFTLIAIPENSQPLESRKRKKKASSKGDATPFSTANQSVKQGILLETRFSKSIIKFAYHLMESDQKLLNMIELTKAHL